MKFLNRSIVTELSLWAGLFGLLTGIIGLLVVSSSAKIHYTTTFTCLSMLIGILLICLGAFNLKYGENMEEIYTDLCIGKSKEIEEIRRIRAQNIDQIMCTSRCPCWSGYQISEEIATTYKKQVNTKVNEDFYKDTRIIVSKWTGYKGLDETYLNKFNRTSSSVPRVVKAYDGITEYVMNPFVWRDYIYDKDGEQISYRSFKECFEKNLLPNGFL